MQTDAELELKLIVTGMHLSPEFGLTVKDIEADGFEIAERIEMMISSDTPQGIAKSTGLGVIGFAQYLARCRPDILVTLGDRFEMFACALAALPFKIPVAHIHGGEITEGAIDDALRHSMTKLSHLHFVSTEEYGRRVVQMGEEPWRVTVSGAPSLDNLSSLRLFDRQEIRAKYGLDMNRDTLIVTYHPVTLEYETTSWQIDELLAALDRLNMPVIFTLPNADTSGRTIIRKIEEFKAAHDNAWMVNNMGTQGYFSVMAQAAAMVGNSSSGIIESPSFRLPVVNIGTRQLGRVKAQNVIDVGYGQEEIIAGIKTAISPQFRESLRSLVNPYGCGQASDEIVKRLKEVALDDRLITKRFYNLRVASAP